MLPVFWLTVMNLGFVDLAILFCCFCFLVIRHRAKGVRVNRGMGSIAWEGEKRKGERVKEQVYFTLSQK